MNNRRESALRKLRPLLASERFPINSRLPSERELAVQLDVSRSALREALELLEAEGKIWRHVGQGTFVGTRPVKQATGLSLVSDMTNPAEVMEVRLIIEPQTARLAALRATADDVAHMRHCLRKSTAARDPKTYEQWDGTLHRAIAEAARNTLLLATFDAVNAVRTQTSWGRMRAATLTPERQKAYNKQHHDFIDAIAERDMARAEALMREHITTVRDSLLDSATSAHADAYELNESL